MDEAPGPSSSVFQQARGGSAGSATSQQLELDHPTRTNIADTEPAWTPSARAGIRTVSAVVEDPHNHSHWSKGTLKDCSLSSPGAGDGARQGFLRSTLCPAARGGKLQMSEHGGGRAQVSGLPAHTSGPCRSKELIHHLSNNPHDVPSLIEVGNFIDQIRFMHAGRRAGGSVLLVGVSLRCASRSTFSSFHRRRSPCPEHLERQSAGSTVGALVLLGASLVAVGILWSPSAEVAEFWRAPSSPAAERVDRRRLPSAQPEPQASPR